MLCYVFSILMTWNVIVSTSVGRQVFRICYDQRFPACYDTSGKISFTW